MASNGSDEAIKDNWAAAPGPAAFDLRSDVHTHPTRSMLAAIQSSSLLDDVWQEDTTTNELEAYVASLTGHAGGLLVLSGTMGNQVALRSHLGGPPHSILTDYRSHIIKYEAGGAAALNGALVYGVTPGNGHHLTLGDVKKQAILSDDVHACPTRVIALENTIAGAIVPLAECQAISRWARARGIAMHLDGARLWEAVAAGAGSLREYCACFDSISLCFSKGLGAPIGSIVVGSAALIKRARWVRKMLGGGLRQSSVVAAPARVAVDETFLAGKLQASHAMARRVEQLWLDLGGKTTLPVETNMVWLDLDDCGLQNTSRRRDSDSDSVSDSESEEDILGLERTSLSSLAGTHGLRITNMGRLVIHYQVGEEAVARLTALMQDLAQRRRTILASAPAAAAAAPTLLPTHIKFGNTAAGRAIKQQQQQQQQQQNGHGDGDGDGAAAPQPDSSMS